MLTENKGYKICWLICILFLLLGLFLINEERIEYSTDEYWIAKNYHHVYDKYSGEIVNTIEDDEYVKLEGDTITVSRKKLGSVAYVIGCFFTLYSGISIAYLVFIFFKEAWQKNHT